MCKYLGVDVIQASLMTTPPHTHTSNALSIYGVQPTLPQDTLLGRVYLTCYVVIQPQNTLIRICSDFWFLIFPTKIVQGSLDYRVSSILVLLLGEIQNKIK